MEIVIGLVILAVVVLVIFRKSMKRIAGSAEEKALVFANDVAIENNKALAKQVRYMEDNDMYNANEVSDLLRKGSVKVKDIVAEARAKRLAEAQALAETPAVEVADEQ